MTGRFCWYELVTSNMADAVVFYTAVVGWEAADAGMPSPYTLVKTAGAPVAGIMGVGPEMLPDGPFWLGYVAVDDVDDVTGRVVAAGGKIHKQPQDIPDVGRFSIVADPQGASFGLFKGNAGAEGADDAPGYVGWRELHAADIDKVMPFYQDLFGWTTDRLFDMGPMGQYHVFNSGSGQQGGAMTSPNMPHPAWTYYFTVGDIDAATDRLKAAGGEVLMGPHEVPGGGWILQAKDRQGAMLALLGKKGG